MGDLGLIPVVGRFPGGGHGNPLHYSCLENPHGRRSLAGYSPWGRKESDMTERLSTARVDILYFGIEISTLCISTVTYIYLCVELCKQVKHHVCISVIFIRRLNGEMNL